jgi:plasmid stability protein
MHRTQILLEEWQYQTLLARAEQEGRSISEVIREILHNTLAPTSRRKRRLKTIEGIGEDSAVYGRAHDRFLYGEEGED